MIKVALFLDGDVYNNDAIFDTSDDNWLNHDNLLHVWINMRDYLMGKGYEVHTFDKYSGFDEIDKAVFFGLFEPNMTHFKKLQQMGKDCYYVAYEPPVIHLFNDQRILRDMSDRFVKILTHQDDLIDNEKFFRVSEGKVHPDLSLHKKIPFNERYFMMMMNSYRYANSDCYRELYSERFRSSNFFEQKDETFHVYGRGLNNPERIKKRWGHKIPVHFNSYVGEVENKMENMCRYKFHLCIENCSGVYGYISEKIIHSFVAGVVPVYWGPVNPLDYFDEGTFIDMRAFKDYEDLYKYLKSIDEKRFNQYLEAIEEYLAGEKYQRFFGTKVFGQQMYRLLADENNIEKGIETDNNSNSTNKKVTLISVDEKPKVSILIPTYNRAELLKNSLDSLVAQNYPNLEVVIVDDCSKDNTAEVVKLYKDKLPQIIYKKNEYNIGAALGFNKAAELASGEYVINYSDDDLLAPNAIEKYIEPAIKKQADLVYSDLAVIDQNGAQTAVWQYQAWPDKYPLLKRLLEAGSNQIPETLLVKRELYPEIYGEYYSKRFITPFFIPKLSSLKMEYVPQPLYKYRVHQDSTFKDVSGLVVRNKGVLNYINLIMMMYDPAKIINIPQGSENKARITVAMAQCCSLLLNHAGKFVKGRFYTGVEYKESDMLWAIFYEFADKWLDAIYKYNIYEDQLDKLRGAIQKGFSRNPYDTVKVNMLPKLYNKLPWFSYRPINKVTEFIPFDMVTLGKHDLFERDRFDLLKNKEQDIYVTNKSFSNVDDMISHMIEHPVQVVNILDADLMEDAENELSQNGKIMAHVVNASKKEWPDNSLMKNTVEIDANNLTDFNVYLKALKLFG